MRLIELISRNSDRKGLLRANNASLQTIMKRGTTMTGRHSNSDADAANPNSCEFTLDEMANDDKHAGNSEDQNHDTSVETNSPIIKTSRVELRPLIQIEVKSAVETAQLREMKSTFRNLV